MYYLDNFTVAKVLKIMYLLYKKINYFIEIQFIQLNEELTSSVNGKRIDTIRKKNTGSQNMQHEIVGVGPDAHL